MALQPGDKYYSGLRLRFGATLRNWAMQSAAQLRDSYRMQKIWDGSRSNSVWFSPRKRKFFTGRWVLRKVGKKGRKVSVREYKEKTWTWYDESLYRQNVLQPDAPNLEYWFSTGLSYKTATGNPVKVINGNMFHAEVAFDTTYGALYAEAGVGATGKKPGAGPKSKPLVRPKDIKVNRVEPWHYDKRYVPTWRPKRGDAHRPNTRQQVSLLARRLKWAARMVYDYQLTTYIAYGLESIFDEAKQVKHTT